MTFAFGRFGALSIQCLAGTPRHTVLAYPPRPCVFAGMSGLPLTSVTVIDALPHDPITSVQVFKISVTRIRVGLRRAEGSETVTDIVVPGSHPRNS